MNRQPNCGEMARELGLSVKTVYRVMANSTQVKEDTRRRVIKSLNKHGFFAARCKTQQNVVFNFRTTDFSSRIIIPLMQNLSHRSFNCIVTELEKNRARFEDAVADALVVVWGNEPDEETMQYGKSLNPNAVHINLLGGGGGDISIDSDDIAGGRIAARHFHLNGHSRVMVASALDFNNARDRAIGFLAEMKKCDRNSHCELLEFNYRDYYAPDHLDEVLPERIKRGLGDITGIFFTQIGPAGCAKRLFAKLGIRVPEDISIISYDRPDYTLTDQNNIIYDSVYYDIEEIIEWCEFYIHNSPLMGCKSKLHSLVVPKFKINDSVRKLN